MCGNTNDFIMRRISSLENTIFDLKSEVSELEMRSTSLQGTLSDSENHRATLEKDLAEVKLQMMSLTEENALLDENLRESIETAADMEHLELEVKDLHEMRVILESRIESLEQECEEVGGKLEALIKDSNEKTDALEATSASLLAAEATAEAVYEELEGVKTERAQLLEMNEDISVQVSHHSSFQCICAATNNSLLRFRRV